MPTASTASPPADRPPHRLSLAPDGLLRQNRLQSDARIAATINRLGHRTAHEQAWTAARVCSIRNGRGILAYREGERQERGELTVDEAAAVLKVTHTTVLRLIAPCATGPRCQASLPQCAVDHSRGRSR